jgi:hypothetical protein
MLKGAGYFDIDYFGTEYFGAVGELVDAQDTGHFCLEAGQIFIAGAKAGDVWVAGSEKARVFSAGFTSKVVVCGRQ